MTRFIVGALALTMIWSDPDVHEISKSGRGAYEVSLTLSNAGGAAAWYDTRDGHPEIYLRLLDKHAQPAGPERRITRGTDFAYEPDIARLASNFAVAWYEKRPDTGRLRAKLALVSPEGEILWSRSLSRAENDGRNPVVRVAGDRIYCAWLEAPADHVPGVWTAAFDKRGEALQPPRYLAAAGRTTWNLNAAVDDAGHVWLAFDATAGTHADELFLAQMDARSSGPVRLSGDDGVASKYPDLAFDGKNVALTWFDERDGNQEVYLFVDQFDRLIKPADSGLDQRSRRITNTPGDSIGAYVTWNRSRVGLAWCDNSDGQNEVYFQPFDSRGEPLHAPRRLTRNPTESLIPAIRGWRDGFAIAWNEFRPSPHGAHAEDSRSEIVFASIPIER